MAEAKTWVLTDADERVWVERIEIGPGHLGLADEGWSIRKTTLRGGPGAIIVAITAIAGKSASLALKLQVPIMVAVGLSFAALALGVLLGEWRAPWRRRERARSSPGPSPRSARLTLRGGGLPTGKLLPARRACGGAKQRRSLFGRLAN